MRGAKHVDVDRSVRSGPSRQQAGGISWVSAGCGCGRRRASGGSGAGNGGGASGERGSGFGGGSGDGDVYSGGILDLVAGRRGWDALDA